MNLRPSFFFAENKENYKDLKLNKEIIKCICCESIENITWHHKLPNMFSKHMSKQYQEENKSPICRRCHDLYEVEADLLKDKFAKKFKIPIEGCYQNNKHITFGEMLTKVMNPIQSDAFAKKWKTHFHETIRQFRSDLKNMRDNAAKGVDKP